MTRPLRLEYPGAWWHVTNRGVEQRDIYLDDRDRRLSLKLLAGAVPRFRWRLHAYVLMTNHHLLVETVEPTLSRGMKKVGGDYAEAFNARYRRAGHLFQGRFKAHLIDSETYLLTVARYIVLNPVRAKMVRGACEWPWSSARATAGASAAPAWLTTTPILDRFDPWDRDNARREYRQFVGDVVAGAKRPWDELVGQLYLGSVEFITRVQQRIDERERSREHPVAQRVVRCATLAEVRDTVVAVTGEGPGKGASASARMAYAALASSEALAPLAEIAVTLGVGTTGVSYLIRRAKERVKRDKSFATLVERLRLTIRNCRLQT